MSFSVSGTRGLCTLQTAYTSNSLTKMGVAYYFLDIPATAGTASTSYNGIFADASFHAWNAGAALNPRNVDVAYFVAVIATVPGFTPVREEFFFSLLSLLSSFFQPHPLLPPPSPLSPEGLLPNCELPRGRAEGRGRGVDAGAGVGDQWAAAARVCDAGDQVGDYAAACIDPDTGVFW